MKQFRLKVFFMLFAFFAISISASAQKMKAEDVVAKHLESIGTKEKRATIKNQVIFSDFTIKVQSSDRFNLVEDFSDYKSLGGLNLPSSYKLSYKYSGTSSVQFAQNSNREIEWTFKITNYSYNQPLDAAAFDINSK